MRRFFAGLSSKLITPVLRPGKRPTGKENAVIIGRVLRRLRAAWPETRIILRSDGYFSNPELMALCQTDPNPGFLFGLADNKVLSPKATPLLEQARALYRQCAAPGHPEPTATRLNDDLDYQAASCVGACKFLPSKG